MPKVEIVFNEDLKLEVAQKMDESSALLDDRERHLLRLRFGIACQELTLAKVGERFGLTRERVRQIEAKALLKIGFSVPADERHVKIIHPNKCVKCRRDITTKYVRYCDPCMGAGRPCTFCGKTVTRRNRHLANVEKHNQAPSRASGKAPKYQGTNVFCNRTCQGKWLGKNHGFEAHPEHAAPTQERRAAQRRWWQSMTPEQQKAHMDRARAGKQAVPA